VKRRISAAAAAIVAALGAAALLGGSAGAQSQAVVQVQLLAINDFHGNLEPPAGSSGRINGVDTAGAAYVATHLKRLAATNPNTIVLSSGDNIGASPLSSALFHDEPTINAMNAMNVELSAVGNHDFDEGVPELLRIQKGGCHPTDGCKFESSYAGAKFQYLAANVLREPTAVQLKAVATYNAKQKAKKKARARFCKTHKGSKLCRTPLKLKLKAKPTAQPLFPAYSVKTIGGVKVGFIGTVLKSTPTIVVPTAVEGLRFLDEAETANKYVPILKKQGVEAIVLLLHQGDESPANADPNGCNGIAGEADPILTKLSSEVSVVLSAHTHQWYVCTVNGRLFTQGASFGRLITQVSLGIDTATGEVVTKTAKNNLVTRDVTPDPTVQAIVDKAKAAAAPLANRVIGSITADITRTETTAGESALGDVIADAQLAATSPANKGGAVVAFMNPGGIRADLTFNQSSGGEAAGQVTYGEAFAVQPFANVMNVKTMTGDMLKRLLEQQFDNPAAGQRRVLQVSTGFTYSYDLSKPAGQRVDASSIRIAGTVVVPTTQYKIAMNSFLAAGGDGFTVFKEGTNQIGGDIDVDALVAYFAAKQSVAPGPRNRIVRTG
jgi:5'-nucleotidase